MNEPTVMATIDTHLHLWNTRTHRHPWLDGTTLPAIASLDDAPGAHHHERRFVLVESAAHPDDADSETQWLSILASDPRVHGIVAATPLADDDHEHRIARLAQKPGVVGIRDLWQDTQVLDDRVSVRKIAKGLISARDHRLSVDVCVRHHQLPALLRLLERVASRDVTIVLDHMGKPPLNDPAAMARWEINMAAMATIPSLTCKISGLAAECTGPVTVHPRVLAAITHVIEQFGAHRCVVGSDWPVSQPDADWMSWVEQHVGPHQWHVMQTASAAVYRRRS